MVRVEVAPEKFWYVYISNKKIPFQENIKSSVESMTEFKVDSINVHVVGVTFNDVDSDFVS